MTIRFGRAVCGDLAASERREWLVTNGIGGYASGTVAGLLTRRYHGLLIAATQPPTIHALLVPKFDETATYLGTTYSFGTNRWADGTIAPRGHLNIESFWLDGLEPVWRFACADGLVEKRVWMARGRNVTHVRYELLRASAPLELAISVFVDGRDHHGSTRAGSQEPELAATPSGFSFTAGRDAPRGEVGCPGMTWSLEPSWYYGFDLARERERGLDARDDHLCAALGTISLNPGSACIIDLSLDGERIRLDAASDDEPGQRRHLACSAATDSPAWVEQLAAAADQFLVDRDDGKTVIAGYPWFTDWGRDTMIALPGLALATGRYKIARSILATFARFVDRGMIPNRFPDSGTKPEYNTVDATLWFVLAVRDYWRASDDEEFARRLFPTLADIVDWHVRGTRYGIGRDPADGLLAAGEQGIQLTWMDAKVGEWVVTPRIGKPIEINALWYNTLVAVAEIADGLRVPRDEYDRLAAQARSGFARFWNRAAGYCYDVIDGPSGADASLRPNQILAVSLPECALSIEQMRGVVDACARTLVTSYGLRSLAPSDPAYRGRYEGDPTARDGAYHQGTVWTWLLGPFALAHRRVYGDAVRAIEYLKPLEDAMTGFGLGTLGEIFNGDPPHEPRGCIAQAWSVAETLRAWTILNREICA